MNYLSRTINLLFHIYVMFKDMKIFKFHSIRQVTANLLQLKLNILTLCFRSH